MIALINKPIWRFESAKIGFFKNPFHRNGSACQGREEIKKPGRITCCQVYESTNTLRHESVRDKKAGMIISDCEKHTPLGQTHERHRGIGCYYPESRRVSAFLQYVLSSRAIHGSKRCACGVLYPA